MTLTSPAAPGPSIACKRNAIRRDNSTLGTDQLYGHYLVGTGSTGHQPDISRTSTFAVAAGHPVEFGVYIGNLSGTWVSQGNNASVTTAYDCR